MKKILRLTIAAVYLLGCSQVSAQLPQFWSAVSWTQWGSNLKWINSNNGILCQASSNSYYTNDGGNTWNGIYASSGLSDISLISKAAVAGNALYIIDGGLLYATYDMVSYYHQFPALNYGSLKDVRVLDPNNVYFTGGWEGAFYAQRNGDWSEHIFLSAGNSEGTAVNFGTPLVGCIGTNDGRLYYTSDSGNTWARAVVPAALSSAFTVWSVCFRNGNEVLAAAHTLHSQSPAPDSALILRSTDAGQTWVVVYAGVKEWLKEIAFRTRDTCYAVGSDMNGNTQGIILQSNDGGQTWSNLAANLIFCELEDITFESSEVGWISGWGGGCVFKYDSRAPTGIVEPGPLEKPLLVYPNPAANVINLSNVEPNTQLVITNVLGETVKSEIAETDSKSIDISSLAPGMYFINHRKFIKE